MDTHEQSVGVGDGNSEAIRGVALKHHDRIFTGASRSEALDALEKAMGRDYDQDDIINGFQTTAGRFVGKDEAERIAHNVGQVL